MTPLLIIAGIPVWLNSDGSLTYLSSCAIDGDGTGPSHGDPDYQDATSLRYDGKSLNADDNAYIVVPPELICAVSGVVLGCKAIVTSVFNGTQVAAVVGDVGPVGKLGEFSINVANQLGIPDSPTTGGTNDHIVAVQLYPGVPAQVYGMTYALQPLPRL